MKPRISHCKQHKAFSVWHLRLTLMLNVIPQGNRSHRRHPTQDKVTQDKDTLALGCEPSRGQETITAGPVDLGMSSER